MTTNGRPAENLDFFRELDDIVCAHEDRGLKVQFLHVPRQLNTAWLRVRLRDVGSPFNAEVFKPVIVGPLLK